MDALKDQKIPTKEFEKLQAELSKAEEKFSDLVAAQKELPKSLSGLSAEELRKRFEAPQEELKKLQSESEQVKLKMSALSEIMENLEVARPSANITGYEEAFEQLKKKMLELAEKREQILKPLNDVEKSLNLAEEIDRAGEKVGDLELRIADLNETGKAFTLGQDTAEYASYARQIQYEGVKVEIIG